MVTKVKTGVIHRPLSGNNPDASGHCRASCVTTVILVAVVLPAFGASTPSPDHSGWRGGIGLACENPSDYIENVSELGYDLCWTWDNPRVIRGLDIALFKYWNGVIETNLNGKDSASGTEGTWDYGALADKNEAARFACDALFENLYGVKGLSAYAKIIYRPDAYYKVGGRMDLSSENPLVKAIESTYLNWFQTHKIAHGGIALDNAARLPKEYLESLRRCLTAHNYGVATNGARDELFPFIDIFGYEGFPFTIDYMRQARRNGFKGVMAEFTMQHLSAGELAAYFQNKQFNGIVFFGYLSSTAWILGEYSRYDHRPDIYDHHRWILRRYVPILRSMLEAGRQEPPLARLGPAVESHAPVPNLVPIDVRESDQSGKLEEYRRPVATMQQITGRFPFTPPEIARYSSDLSHGLYFYVDSGKPEVVLVDANALGVKDDMIVFDEFSEQVLPSTLQNGSLRFMTTAGPDLVVVGQRPTIVRNILLRARDSLRTQLAQRAIDHELGKHSPQKDWEAFCQGWTLDSTVGRSGNASLKTEGRSFYLKQPKNAFFNRQGAAQLVNLNQTTPRRITLTVASRANDVTRVDSVDLNRIGQRRTHFDIRDAYSYCARLYLDYQDGSWPEVHAANFQPGTHDWEIQTITVTPQRPVKTAQVVIEFQQPTGTAWFDDLTLCQGDDTENLIAAAGFEENDASAAEAVSLSANYEDAVRSLVDAVDRATATPDATALANVASMLNRAAAYIETPQVRPYYGREIRDLADLRRKLDLCSTLVIAR